MFEKIKEIINSTLSCGEDIITMEASLIDDLGADSLDAVELCMTLEEEFDITIPEDKIADLKTVKDIVDYVESLA
jgi:acyl carrier protein